MCKNLLILFLIIFFTPAYPQDNEEQNLNQINGIVAIDLYSSVLRNTQNETWAQAISDAFKDDVTFSKKLKVQANYSFLVDSNDQITDARLVVGHALVEKELIEDENTYEDKLVTKLPPVEDQIFVTPVDTDKISSPFSLSRKHPVKRRKILPHNGIDFSAKIKTPIFPALDGIILTMGRAKAKGKYITILHDNGMKTSYDHLRKFQKGLRIGDYVDESTQIGEVGRTGRVTGAHLHFTLMNPEGFYVNPLPYLKDFQKIPVEESEEVEPGTETE